MSWTSEHLRSFIQRIFTEGLKLSLILQSLRSGIPLAFLFPFFKVSGCFELKVSVLWEEAAPSSHAGMSQILCWQCQRRDTLTQIQGAFEAPMAVFSRISFWNNSLEKSFSEKPICAESWAAWSDFSSWEFCHSPQCLSEPLCPGISTGVGRESEISQSLGIKCW